MGDLRYGNVKFNDQSLTLRYQETGKVAGLFKLMRLAYDIFFIESNDLLSEKLKALERRDEILDKAFGLTM